MNINVPIESLRSGRLPAPVSGDSCPLGANGEPHGEGCDMDDPSQCSVHGMPSTLFFSPAQADEWVAEQPRNGTLYTLYLFVPSEAA